MSEERKATLIAAHAAVFEDLLDAVADLEPTGWSTDTGCPGWDVRDQVAHIVAIERTMLGDPPDEVELPGDLSHVRDDFGRFVEVGVQARRPIPVPSLLAECGETFDRRLRALAELDPESLGIPMDGPGGMRGRASGMLRTRVFDMTCHVDDIRRALDRPGPTTGPHRTIAVEQVLRAWARYLPARLGDDRAVLVDVADHEAVTIDLGDGGLHRQGSGPDPAAGLRLTSGQLLALGCGRTDAPTAPELEAFGDTELVSRWIAAAAITP